MDFEETVPLVIIENIIYRWIFSVVQIRNKSKNKQVSASLIEIIVSGRKVYAILTIHSYVTKEDIDSRLDSIDFLMEEKRLPNLKKFQLVSSDIQKCIEIEQLNITLVLLTASKANFLMRNNAIFLKPNNSVIRENEQIFMVQYPNGVISFAYGKYIRNDDHVHYYCIGTGKGSSGSPVVNSNGEIFCIHGGKAKEREQESRFKCGVDIKYLFDKAENQLGIYFSCLIQSYV